MSTMLPAWRSVLAVVAHPDDESFGLGGVLAAFASTGAQVSVLCFTKGEASTLHGVDGDLADIRAVELADAARELGASQVQLHDHPDGGLGGVATEVLLAEVLDMVERVGADGIVVFDPDGVTGHPDHRAASEVALAVARPRQLPVLGWTIPTRVAEQLNVEYGAAFTGHDDIDVVVRVDRETQRRAIACHPSQAVPGSVLWRRLELLEDTEHLRHLG
jgi:LmbE family N-acetylglucosaminyl deacetylase